MSNSNIAATLDDSAARHPMATAVVEAHRCGSGYEYQNLSFQYLLDDTNKIANGLRQLGIAEGKRVALMVRPSYDFIALTFAMFKSGCTLVLIDPGMGRKNMLGCLEAVALDGFVAIPVVHLARRLYRKRFPQAALNVVVADRWAGSTPTLRNLRRISSPAHCTTPRSTDDDAAIIFTTGSTGPPKGVLYTHGTFRAQVQQIQSQYDIQPGGTDLAGFPLFGLFNAAMGMTTVVPDMDASRPASVNPVSYVAHLRDQKVTQSFASPAVWNVVGEYCRRQEIQLPNLRRVLSAGAPVPPHVLQWVVNSMPDDGEMHTPYGATEALPVATISAKEVLGETAAMSAVGKGTCVGKRFGQIDWRVIRIMDGDLVSIDQTEPLEVGEIGELIVRGPQVTRCYVTSESANAAHKVADGDTFWHRMGDVGYLDDQDRFWFCGRKAHRVRMADQTLYSVPTEAIFNEHANIYRSALVGVGTPGNQQAAVVCEPWTDRWPRNGVERRQLTCELAALAATHDFTTCIDSNRIFLKRALPVDIRHNAKIFREQLVPWVARRLPKSLGLTQR